MRAVLAIAFLTVLGCGGSSTEPKLGDNIEVRYGASVTIPGDTASARFTDVTSDSRCPSGVQCVWAGEATVLFTIAGNTPVSLALGSPTVKATAIVRGKQMTLVALRPAPAAGSAIAKSDYVATLRFTSAND